MRVIVENIHWGPRLGYNSGTLPRQYIVENALDLHDAKNCSVVHFDAEIEQADAEVIPADYKPENIVVVSNA